MKKGAIFDMDGLLFDTERLYRESWQEIAVQFGLTPDPQFPWAVAGTSGEGMQEVVRQYYPQVDAQAFIARVVARVESMVEQHVPQKPGMREILEYLRNKQAKIAVASSSSQKTILHNLQKAQAESYFDAVVSGEQVENGKPAPDIFLAAAAKIGLAPQECYVLEDGVNGARAGIAAGCTTVMVPERDQLPDDLRKNCAGIYHSLHEVRAAMEAGEL